MTSKNILVTGGSGFLGAALVNSLVNDGHNVRVFDNNSRGKKSRLDGVISDIDLVEGDIRDANAVNEATKGVDWVFHLAFVNGTRHFYERPSLVLDVGLRGALTTMDAAMAHGVEKYIVASSSEVYNEPENIPTDENERLIITDPSNPRFSYSGGKLITELLTMHYLRDGPEKIIFRPHNVYGPDMGWEHVVPEFFKRVRRSKHTALNGVLEFPIQGTGDETRAFCFIDDAVQAIKLCSDIGVSGEIYNVGVDNETTISSLAQTIGKICGLELDLIKNKQLDGSTTRRCPDISKIKELGYFPDTSLDDGLQRCSEFYLKSELPN